MFFRLSTWSFGSAIAAVVLGFVALGYVVGVALRSRAEKLREPIGVVQGALLALVGLILAFGLTLAIGRYDGRRGAVVDDANAIGTAYLRAQTLAEPERSRFFASSCGTRTRVSRLSNEVPTTAGFLHTVAEESALQRPLWRLAGQALDESPRASAPRL